MLLLCLCCPCCIAAEGWGALAAAIAQTLPHKHARPPLSLAAFCSRSPDSPTEMFRISLATRISRMGLLAFSSLTCVRACACVCPCSAVARRPMCIAGRRQEQSGSSMTESMQDTVCVHAWHQQASEQGERVHTQESKTGRLNTHHGAPWEIHQKSANF